MKTVSEARAAVVRAWEELPPVSKLEVREVEPTLAQALDELVSVVAAATRVVQAPETWVPEQDPAVRRPLPNVEHRGTPYETSYLVGEAVEGER